MHLLFPHPSINFVQNILCSFAVFIETRSVHQNESLFLHFRFGRAYGMVMGLQAVAGPTRCLGETVNKLLPAQYMRRDESQEILLGSCRNHTAQPICMNVSRSTNSKEPEVLVHYDFATGPSHGLVDL